MNDNMKKNILFRRLFHIKIAIMAKNAVMITVKEAVGNILIKDQITHNTTAAICKSSVLQKET